MHPDHYRSTILAQFPEELSLFEAFLMELGIINEQCEAIGEDWILADRPDFEGLEVELKKGGHVGSFWTASVRPKTSLEYALNGEGDSRYQWALSGNDAERIVLCVVAFQID